MPFLIELLRITGIVTLCPKYRLDRNSLLLVATKRNYIDVVRYLVKKGVDINFQETIRDNLTPLMIASRFNSHQLVELLLNNGAIINQRSLTCGNTALHLAVKNDNRITVDILLFHGANTNITNNDGFTPLHKAVIYNASIDIIKKLLRYKADVNIRDNEEENTGLTPLDIAMSCNNYEIISLLVSHVIRLDYSTCMSNKTKGFDHNKKLVKDNKRLQRIAIHCLKDIEKMKQVSINSRFTLFDLFVDNNVDLLLRCINKDNRFIVNFDKKLTVFNILYTDFIDTFMSRHVLLNKASKVLEDLFLDNDSNTSSWNNLPNEIKDHIFTYINNDELKIMTGSKT